MKKILLFALAFIAVFSVTAQVNVKLRINHKMNGGSFALNTETVNNLGNKMNFNRVQYYLSDIRIVHDGGVVTTAKDTYLLVDAAKPMDFALGSYNVTKVEEIYFSVGIDKTTNHEDFMKYPSHHPLGPKTPSMHWGWTSGYRFVAIGGKSGSSLNLNWEIHSLFDDYYYSIYLPVTGTMENGEMVIAINADYAKALSKIDLSSGMVVHGDRKQDVTVLSNFRDSVFSNLSGVLDLEEVELEKLEAYPNPTTGDLHFNNAVFQRVKSIRITNALGVLVKEINSDGFSKINLESNGVYFINYLHHNNTAHVQKVVVQGN